MQKNHDIVSVPLGAVVGAGIASAILFVAGMIALGTPPTTEQSGADVVGWLGEHRDRVRWYVLAVTANTPVLGFFFAYLRQPLPPLFRDMFLFGAAILLVTMGVQAWTWGGLAVRADALDPAIARSILDVALFWGPVLTGATITMMFPVTWLALDGTYGFPQWLGLLGVIVITEQAPEMITIFGSTGFIAPGGAMNLHLGAGLFTIWLTAFIVCSARLQSAR